MNHRSHRHVWRATQASLLILAVSASAGAQPASVLRPWEQGVSIDDMSAARRLFDHAVELHEQLLREQAMARYEEALAYWDNPKIRWNLALLTRDMGQYLRAYEHLERALAWGTETLDNPDGKKIVRLQQKLLRQHLAIVEARCDQSGVEIALDGKPWFQGPGTARQVVLPGEHLLTAMGAGYFPLAKSLMLPAGTQGAITVSMSVDAIYEQRRWNERTPWGLVGAGMALGLVGGGLDWYRRTQLDDARRELAEKCDHNPTCPPTTPDAYGRSLRARNRARRAFAAGGAVAAVGLFLVLLNQPRIYRTEARGRATFEIMPMEIPDTTGVSAKFEF